MEAALTIVSVVIGLYAGLRPLVDTEGLSESEISREHTVRRALPGQHLTSVIAREGRLTVRYRIVDTLDGALTASGGTFVGGLG